MKKYAWPICLLLITALLLTGCSSKVETFSPQEKLAELEPHNDSEDLVTQAIHSGNYWDVLFEDYNTTRFYIYSGTDAEELEEIYSVKGCYIFHIASNKNYVAWCEEDEMAAIHEYKLYDRNTKQVSTILRIEDSPYFSYSEETFGFFNDSLYLIAYNAESDTIDLMRYDLITAVFQTVYTFPAINTEMPFHIVTMEENRVSAVLYAEKGAAKLISLDVTAPENVTESILSEEVDEVYDISYDAQNNLFAIAYFDEDVNEKIALFDATSQETTPIISLSDNSMVAGAFQCKNGHLYFISMKSPISFLLFFGNSNYALVDYDYINKTIRESEDFSDFSFDGNTLYGVRSERSLDEDFSLWKVF